MVAMIEGTEHRLCRRGKNQRGIGMSNIVDGELEVESGDVISGTVLDGQYHIDLVSGLPIGSGLWAAIVDSGGTLVGAEIINFGGVGVNTGGVAIDTVVSSGLLGVAGVAINTLDYSIEEVGYGGVTIDTTVAGFLEVFSGSTASNTVVSGGSFELWGSSVASNTTVIGGGFRVLVGCTAIDT